MYSRHTSAGRTWSNLGSTFSVLATSLPLTTFAQNNGVISLTAVASRQAGWACAIWLFVLGVIAKIAAVITCQVVVAQRRPWHAATRQLPQLCHGAVLLLLLQGHVLVELLQQCAQRTSPEQQLGNARPTESPMQQCQQ